MADFFPNTYFAAGHFPALYWGPGTTVPPPTPEVNTGPYVGRKKKKPFYQPEPLDIIEPDDDDEVILAVIQEFMRGMT